MINLLLHCESNEQKDIIIGLISRVFPENDFEVQAFDYEMDMLDFINTERPDQCVLVYVCFDGAVALDAAKTTERIGRRFRFVLISEVMADAEMMFYSGVCYYINRKDIEKGIVRCCDYLASYYELNKKKHITLNNKNGRIDIPLSDIEYITSDKRKIIVYCAGTEYQFYYKLDEIEEMIDESFVRCHQSFMVNMDYIDQFVEDGLILTTGQYIPVSRKKYYYTKRMFVAYKTEKENKTR